MKGLGTALVVLIVVAADAAAQSTNRIVGTIGQEGDADTEEPTLSADGRLVAFQSLATDWVLDVNGPLDEDVFVHDRLTGETLRVSENALGVGGDRRSYFGVLSSDGLWCVFRSEATNLVPGDTNAVDDVFVKDLLTGAIERVSVSSGGAQGDSFSKHATISADGRVVAFRSSATNLVDGDTNGEDDIFVHDRLTGSTTRVSVSSAGEQGDAASKHADVSDDGLLVGFRSTAANLVPGDGNGVDDVFVTELATGLVERVSVSSAGLEGDGESFYPSLSADGRLVAFMSYATNLVAGDTNGWPDVFVHDRLTGETTRVSTGTGGHPSDGPSLYPYVCDDGSAVGFLSGADNLVPGDTNGQYDAFVKVLATNVTLRLSVGNAGEQGDAMSWRPRLSADGRVAAFASLAGTLVPDDGNGAWDVFVHDTQGPWAPHGDGLAGANGVPQLALAGGPLVGEAVSLDVAGGPPGALLVLVVGLSLFEAPLKGGTLVPHDDLMLGFGLDPAGALGFDTTWPAGLPSHARLHVQAWMVDAGGPQGWSATQAMWAVVP